MIVVHIHVHLRACRWSGSARRWKVGNKNNNNCYWRRRRPLGYALPLLISPLSLPAPSPSPMLSCLLPVADVIDEITNTEESVALQLDVQTNRILRCQQ